MKRFALTTAVLMSILLAGCTSVPIMNVDRAAVTTVTGNPATREQVRNAIVRAGTGLGWQFRDESPNMLVGTLVIRSHTAVIEIPYSRTEFSIRHRSSVNLDESGGNIHRNYNAWIQNLTRAINAQLANL